MVYLLRLQQSLRKDFSASIRLKQGLEQRPIRNLRKILTLLSFLFRGSTVPSYQIQKDFQVLRNFRKDCGSLVFPAQCPTTRYGRISSILLNPSHKYDILVTSQHCSRLNQLNASSPEHVYPEGPSTQCFRTLVLKTIPFMVFGTRVLKYWVLGPSGILGVVTHRMPWYLVMNCWVAAGRVSKDRVVEFSFHSLVCVDYMYVYKYACICMCVYACEHVCMHQCTYI